MGAGSNRSKPFCFNLMTRIVYVHAAFSLVLLTSALMQALARTSQLATLVAGLGLVIAVAAACAMFGVAKQRSLRALALLRLLLWITVAKVLLGMFAVIAASNPAMVETLRPILLNEVVLIGLLIYWSRPVHARYLSSMASS